MKRQLLWLVLAIVVAGCKSKQDEIHPELKLLTSAVYASGSLVPKEEYKVVSSVDGYLVDAFVKEGDTVHTGQLLFKISSEVRQVQEQGASQVVQKTIPSVNDNAPALRELEGRIDVARIQKAQDSLQYVRYKNLFDQNAISASTNEKYYLQYQSSLKNYQNLRQQWQQQKLAGDLQLQQAKNQLSVAAAQSGVGNLKSFVNGVVYDIYKKQGDLVMPNQPVALIGAGKMFARLLIDEDDLDKIHNGQKVVITMDAFPDKVFSAHIAKIYPLLSKVEQSFRADAELDDTIPTGMYGLNLEANIVVAEKQQVLALPKGAVLKGDSVIIKKDGKEEKVKIKKGIEDDEYVQVLGGIDQTTTVIVKK